MPEFPFEWWLITLISLCGTIVWLVAIFYAALKGRTSEEAKKP